MLRLRVFVWGDPQGEPSWDIDGVTVNWPGIGPGAEATRRYIDHVAGLLQQGGTVVLHGRNQTVIVPANAVRSIVVLPVEG